MGAPNIKTSSEGPRLESRTLSDSAYGMGIPIAFGTARLEGNIIWAKEIEEEKVSTTTRTGGKGGGKVSNTNTTYNYFLTCAIAFAEGEAKQLMQLWADGKLIYSQKTGTGQGTKEGLNFRFYRGTEEQLPDAAIELDRGDAPAHRGLVYLVLERFPLQDFGNRPPAFTAEIAFSDPADDASFFETTALDVSAYGGFTSDDGAFDWQRNRFYCKTDDNSGIYVVQLNTMEIIGKLPLFDLHGVSQVSGKLVGRSGNDDVVVNPVSGGIEVSNSSNNNTSQAVGYSGNVLSLQADDGLYEIFVSRYHFGFGSTFTATWRTHAMGTMTFREELVGLADGGYIKFSAARPGSGLGFYGFIDTTQATIYRLQATRTLTPGPPGPFGLTGSLPGPGGMNRTLIRTLTPANVKAGATTFIWYGPDGWRAVADPVSEGYLIWCVTDLGNHVIKLDRDGNTLWVTDIPSAMDPTFGNATYDSGDRVGGDSWTIVSNTSGDHILKINVSTGEIDSYFDGTQDFGVDVVTSDGTYVWDDASNCLFARNGNNFLRFQIGPRDAVSCTVASIITSLSERVGLVAGTDFDVSDLTGSVNGFILDSATAVKAALEPLSQLFFFDPVERDGKIFYRERGDTPSITITESEFIQKTNDRPEQYEETIKQELELPASVTIGFMDADLDYNPGSVTFKRIQGPTSTVQSYDQEEISAAAALQYTAAKQMAEKIAFTRWMERSEYSFRLHWGRLALEPADVVTVSLDTGFTFRGRFGDLDIGSDFSLESGNLTQENAGQYVSTAVSDGADGNPGSLPVVGPTNVFLIDAPLLTDSDSNTTASRSYWMGANYGQGAWPGALLNRSSDNTAWLEMNQLVDDAAWGVTTAALGDPESVWRTDTVNTIEVSMVTGGDDLASATETEVLNGANAGILLKADGTVEVVQWQTVTVIGNGNYELSGLLRGRRGTDTMAFNHTANETFLVLTDASLGRFSTAHGSLNVDFYYKAPTFGQTFDQAVVTTFEYTGRDLMPYAPTNVTCTDAGGGDVDIAWQRRTRIGGELLDGTGDVPLNEASELYDLEVMDPTFTTVLRTVSNNATTDYTYTNANRITDGTDGDTTLYLRVYQRSATVGRGFTHDWTVEIV